MEVAHHHIEAEEQLLTRRRRPDFANGDENIGNGMSSGYESDESEEKVEKNGIEEKSVYFDKNEGHESEEKVEKNGIAENSVYFDKNEGMWKCHHCIWTHKFASPWIDHVHQKSFIHGFKETALESSLSNKDLITEELDIPKLVNAIINSPNGGNLDDKVLSSFGLRSKEDNVRIDLVEEDSDEEVIELEFERAVEKTHTHTPYCPNCSSQITKVILRRRKRDTHRRDKPVNLLGCLECFSIFIPSGNCLNPFRLFGSKGKQETTQIVAENLQSEATLPVSQGGTTSTVTTTTTTTIKQASGGNAFDLFKVFNNGTENVNAEESQGTDHVKQNGERKNEEEIAKKLGQFHAFSSPHKDVNNSSPIFSLSNGDVNSSPHISLSIGDEKTDGIIRDNMKSSIKQEIEIKVEQSIKTREFGGEGTGETSDTRGRNEANFGNLAAISRADSGSNSLEILKCIVYGGLLELITSLSVVSSAAASDATTVNIIAIGMAMLISGLIVFVHNLVDLKNDVSNSEKYQEQLGRRGHFCLHASFALLAYIIFGLVPPITYGFAFRESDNKDYKILAVGIASLACIFLLAIAKVYVRRSKTVGDYFKSIMYYLTMAISVSGVSYAAGDLVKMGIEKFGWFEPTQAVNFFMPGVGGSATF